MRWYVNDTSLQGQFIDGHQFEIMIRTILSARARIESLRTGLFTTRMLRDRPVTQTSLLRETIQRSDDADFRRAVLGWLDRSGPFVEDDRTTEADDYFEYGDTDITNTGLGEAARRTKAREPVASFSFSGGRIPFELTPLSIDHGIDGDRQGSYSVENFWTVAQLTNSALESRVPAVTWKGLIESARERFPFLLIPNSVYENGLLAREPFEATIRDRTFALLGYLNLYMSDRAPNGAEGRAAKSVINNFFSGQRALFSGESLSNQAKFREELTFRDPAAADRTIFAHWHGKISYRMFRLHFEWPVPASSSYLKILYLGPKLTKS